MDTWNICRQTFNIRNSLIGNTFVDHSDVVGAALVQIHRFAPARLDTCLLWIGQRQLPYETRIIKFRDLVHLISDILRLYKKYDRRNLSTKMCMVHFVVLLWYVFNGFTNIRKGYAYFTRAGSHGCRKSQWINRQGRGFLHHVNPSFNSMNTKRNKACVDSLWGMYIIHYLVILIFAARIIFFLNSLSSSGSNDYW